MLAIIRKRLVLLLLVLLGVTTVTFAISNVIPGDPASMIVGERSTPEMIAKVREELGLNQPLWRQFVVYVGNLLEGNLGTSIRTQRPVVEDISRFLPATLELVVVALAITVLTGVPLGVASAVWRGGWLDVFSRTIAVLGISMPAFWLGLILIAVVYGRLGLLPGGGRLPTGMPAPPFVTGAYSLDALIAWDFGTLKQALRHLALPAISLGFLNVGVVARQIRSSMIEVLQEDYVRTARANGLSRFQVVIGHALRNALIPAITIVGLIFGELIYGAVMTETVFGWPGMGNYVVQSIAALDFPAIMGFTVVASVAYVFINLAVDLVYILLDPKIRSVG